MGIAMNIARKSAITTCWYTQKQNINSAIQRTREKQSIFDVYHSMWMGWKRQMSNTNDWNERLGVNFFEALHFKKTTSDVHSGIDFSLLLDNVFIEFK